MSAEEATGTDAPVSAMRRAGLTTLPAVLDPDALAAARLQGRRVAEAARSQGAKSRISSV